jgi:hypothetical protein
MSNETQQSPVEWFAERIQSDKIFNFKNVLQQAKGMERDKHKRFNKFLDDEKVLGIADLKTIERIQWYYNTYFNETYGGGEQ